MMKGRRHGPKILSWLVSRMHDDEEDQRSFTRITLAIHTSVQDVVDIRGNGGAAAGPDTWSDQSRI